ncbi:MAG TPA: nucleoside triphosphate pyrophosphatase [Candidatus Acidoferrales bacterium]|nr:nucleoside triphosphate pyrophosphatase [Candidatus Acidoferrales bacterium]
MPVKLILASGSPRRAEILRSAGLSFEPQPAYVDESLLPGERAEDYVLRLAKTKAQIVATIAAKNSERTFVIGADTTVVCDGRIFAKPENASEAHEMLRALSGKTHEVLTGIAIIRTPDGLQASGMEATRVTFASLSQNDIDAYIVTGEPFDKAGGYGIQGIGGKFISRIDGCYFNVMGLPLSRVWQMLRALGWREETADAASQ